MRGVIVDGPADLAAWALVPAALAPALSGGIAAKARRGRRAVGEAVCRAA